MDEKVIEIFNERMKRHEISRAEMARRVGIEQSTLGKYLLKKRKMPLDIALLMAKNLGVDISFICNIQYEKLTDNEKEIIASLKKVPDNKRTSVTLAVLNIIKVLSE